MCYAVMGCITLSGVYRLICNNIMISVDCILAYVLKLKHGQSELLNQNPPSINLKEHIVPTHVNTSYSKVNE